MKQSETNRNAIEPQTAGIALTGKDAGGPVERNDGELSEILGTLGNR